MRSRAAVLLLTFVAAAACSRAPRTEPQVAPAAARDAAGLTLTYLANEGVLVETGDSRILIDGLHRRSDLPYATLPDAERLALEGAEPPWHDLDLLLVSHLHRDHFHAEAVGTHLARAPGAELVTSEEVAGEIARGFAGWDTIEPRVRALPWFVGRIEEVSVPAAVARVTFLGLSHGGGPVANVQNFGHLVEVGGWKILHVGDAVPSVENFRGLGLETRGIDVALLPWWHVASDAALAVVKEHIAPRRLVLVHVAPVEEAEVDEHIRARAPDAMMFRRMLKDELRLPER